jgi:hypothetical protein
MEHGLTFVRYAPHQRNSLWNLNEKKGQAIGNPSEGVKKLGRSVKRRYLQSFRIAVFHGHRAQGSANEGK